MPDSKLRQIIVEYTYRSTKGIETIARVPLTDEGVMLKTPKGRFVASVNKKHSKRNRDEAVVKTRGGPVQAMTPEEMPIAGFFHAQLKRYKGIVLVPNGQGVDLYMKKIGEVAEDYLGTVRLMYDDQQ